jgi:hypothetical protein
MTRIRSLILNALRVDRFGVERRWRVQHEELACG